jgi:HlyD family secretion protein
MRRLVSRLLLLLIVLGVAGAIVWGFLPRPVPVDLAHVVRGPLRETVDEEGRTRIKDRYVVSTPLAGSIHRITLRAGDPVTAGETLITTVDPTDPSLLDERTRAQAEAALKAAEAARERAEAEVARADQVHEHAAVEERRMSSLLRTSTVSTQEYDAAAYQERIAAEELKAAQFAARIAVYEVEQAEAALLHSRPAEDGGGQPPRYEIRAPVDGRVLRVMQENAAVVPAGTPLLEVGDLREMEVAVDVLSRDAVRVRPGDHVLLERWGGEGALEGRVRLVEPSAFTKISALGVEEQRVNVLIDFVGEPSERANLGDGFRVEARIVVWEQADVLKVPSGALFRHGDAWAVFRREGDVARRVDVEVGRASDAETQVLSGLAAGDVVVLHPSDKVGDGTRVQPREAEWR